MCSKNKNKKYKQPRKCPIDELLNEKKIEIIQIDYKSLDLNYIVVARCT